MKKKEASAAAKAKTSTRKRKAADEEAGAVVETEPENDKKPKKRQRSKKDKKQVDETEPECGEAAAPTEEASKLDSGEKPKAKSKAKVKTEKKTKVVEPKAKAKRAAKSKAKASNKKPVKDDESGDDEVLTDAQKLRKKLFQSDDDGSDESEHERLDAKTGKVAPLKDILEKCEVDKHNAKNRKQDATEPEESTPVKARGSKNKNKSKKKDKAQKVDLSPFAKKEVTRRKKKEKEVMQHEAKENEQIQAIVRQHLKNVEKLTYEDVKTYLRKHLTNSKKSEFKLNEYWGRPACGVKVPALGDGSLKKAPEVVYIGRYGTCPEGWNYNMACVYVSASLMASWFDPYTSWETRKKSGIHPIVAAMASFSCRLTKRRPACLSFCTKPNCYMCSLHFLLLNFSSFQIYLPHFSD